MLVIFKGSTVLVWKDRESSGDEWLCDVLNANELYTQKWVTWYISCYIFYILNIFLTQ